MPTCPPVHFLPWSFDENDRLILLRVPEQIKLHQTSEKSLHPPSLSTLDKPGQPPRLAPTLASLPLDIHYTIIHHLAPVERVCLALTCHRLCASVLASPRLTSETWVRFLSPSNFSNHYRNASASPLSLAPESFQLRQRLAHGWVDKKQWRYCWKCHNILPRDERWWRTARDHKGEKRLRGRKKPVWTSKTGVPKHEWLSWSKRKRLQWLLDVWCKAEWEDSSVINCDSCREDLLTHDVERLRLELTSPKATVVTAGSREFDVARFIGTRHPVECPSCLERELTFTWRLPRRVVAKRMFWSSVECLSNWLLAFLYCIGTVVLGSIVLLWECTEWVGSTIAQAFTSFYTTLVR